MKRVLTAVLCLAIPGLLLLNAWEGYRYNSLSDDVAALEARQSALLEANRDAIGQIAYESSADRVAAKASVLGLQPLDQSSVIRLRVDAQAAPAAAPAAAHAATGARP
jgi:hypothetical protein